FRPRAVALDDGADARQRVVEIIGREVRKRLIEAGCVRGCAAERKAEGQNQGNEASSAETHREIPGPLVPFHNQNGSLVFCWMIVAAKGRAFRDCAVVAGGGTRRLPAYRHCAGAAIT